MNEFGRRTRLTPTRAGLVSETYYVCYTCSAELDEADTASHACEGYCEHGTYVGGVMEDFMCGYCEA